MTLKDVLTNFEKEKAPGVRLKEALKSYDYVLALVTIGLGVFGVVMIYTFVHGSGALSAARAMTHIVGRQQMYIISGAVLMIIFSAIDYHILTRFFIFVYGFMLVLLFVVMFIGVTEGTGVARWVWIPIPGFGPISMQPSEFAKLFMILFLAKYLSVINDRFNHVLWLGLTLVLIVVPVVFVMRQPSLSASLVILFVSLTMLFVGGLYYRTILIGSVLLTPAVVMVWFDIRREDPLFLLSLIGRFQWDRIQIWRNPIPGHPLFHQTEGSLRAIGNGGLTGTGFMNTTHVIHGHNDFVFSLVSEQFGFLGATVLLLVTAFLIFKCIFISLRAIDMEGRLIAAGVSGMLIFETFVHVGVATNLLPNTGMPFPFVSYGGSMIWVHMMAIGVVLNVGLPRTKNTMFGEDDDSFKPGKKKDYVKGWSA